MLTDEDISKLFLNLKSSIGELYADDPNFTNASQSLIKTIAEISTVVFTEGIREYEKLKSESLDSAN